MTLPFTPDEFFDVLATYNQQLWPYALGLWLLTLYAVIAMTRATPRGPLMPAVLALHWAWSGLAYHAAFFAHYYLGPNDAGFRPWAHHRPRYESLHAPPEPMGEPYTRAQVLDYLSQCAAMVDPMIDALDLTSRDPGFSWYKVSKVEHQIINIRHIQHHAVYLSAALRASGKDPVTWISPTRSDENASAG